MNIPVNPRILTSFPKEEHFFQSLANKGFFDVVFQV
jgi:hypothetical protein